LLDELPDRIPVQMTSHQYFKNQHVQSPRQKIGPRFVCSHRLSDYTTDTFLPGSLVWRQIYFRRYLEPTAVHCEACFETSGEHHVSVIEFPEGPLDCLISHSERPGYPHSVQVQPLLQCSPMTESLGLQGDDASGEGANVQFSSGNHGVIKTS
jgi:hypothetical protein